MMTPQSDKCCNAACNVPTVINLKALQLSSSVIDTGKFDVQGSQMETVHVEKTVHNPDSVRSLKDQQKPSEQEDVPLCLKGFL